MPPKKGPAYGKNKLRDDAMRVFDDFRRSENKFDSKKMGERWFQKWNQNAWKREQEAARKNPFATFKSAAVALKSMRKGYYPYRSSYSKHKKK